MNLRELLHYHTDQSRQELQLFQPRPHNFLYFLETLFPFGVVAFRGRFMHFEGGFDSVGKGGQFGFDGVVPAAYVVAFVDWGLIDF